MQINELVELFLGWNARHQWPATVDFYRAPLRNFREAYNDRDLASLTPLGGCAIDGQFVLDLATISVSPAIPPLRPRQ